MEKNIPIDQLFQQKLSHGEEQLNLGAWANMERLLDGKNPYSEIEETKKKRRILPFLAFFILLSGALSAGYISMTKKSSDKEDKVAENSHAPIIQNGKTETIALANGNENISINSTENISSNESESNKNAQDSSIQSDEKQNTPLSNSNKNESLSLENSSSVDNNNEPKNIQSTIVSNRKKSKNKDDIASIKNELISKNTTNEKNSHLEKNLIKEAVDIIPTINKKTKQEIIKDTISLIEIQEKKTAKNSKDKSVEYDTVGRYSKVVEKTIDVIVEEAAPIAKAKVVNPRMVNLSPEEELNASKKIDLKPINDVAFAQKNEVANSVSSNLKKETQTEKAKSSDNGYSNSIFNKMKEFSNKIAMKRVQFYPGMSVGINAALFNTEHNYGGFHFGLNNLIPVSNYFSILSELKIFYKKNSGYSVNDKNSTIFDYNVDATTLASQNQTIHSYQVDSLTKKYNFKSYSTLELPIMLQAHFGKFTPYIGANLSYGFKLNTTEISKNYGPIYTDTLSNSTNFILPANSSYQFVREDFGSRFGFGYTIGTSYTINPNLYIDLRLSNILKDNAKTLSAREISDGIFRVPFMQFSIGYRFKKFTPNN